MSSAASAQPRSLGSTYNKQDLEVFTSITLTRNTSEKLEYIYTSQGRVFLLIFTSKCVCDSREEEEDNAGRV
jgi:hypothetical protein